MSNNVLPDSVIVAIVYFLLQLGKPLLNGIVPQEATYQNNVVRAVGYILTYVLVCVNFLVTHPLHWPDLWGLLPVAGALYGASALLYHVQDDNGAAAAPEGQATRTIVVPAEARVQVAVPPATQATGDRRGATETTGSTPSVGAPSVSGLPSAETGTEPPH